jgi:hypothetical protein
MPLAPPVMKPAVPPAFPPVLPPTGCPAAPPLGVAPDCPPTPLSFHTDMSELVSPAQAAKATEPTRNREVARRMDHLRR